MIDIRDYMRSGTPRPGVPKMQLYEEMFLCELEMAIKGHGYSVQFVKDIKGFWSCTAVRRTMIFRSASSKKEAARLVLERIDHIEFFHEGDEE